MYFVYILKSLTNGQYYKGFTNNIDRRLEEHNRGDNSYTSKFLPYQLVFVQICPTIAQARDLEKYLKSGTGREIIPELTA